MLTSERLSDLYGTPIDVLRVRGRVIVVGAPDSAHGDPDGAHHHHPVGDEHEHEHTDGRVDQWV